MALPSRVVAFARDVQAGRSNRIQTETLVAQKCLRGSPWDSETCVKDVILLAQPTEFQGTLTGKNVLFVLQ